MVRKRMELVAETRGKLLAAARKAFGTKGYAEASMDDFTADAGLTRGALYYQFGDKQGLFRAVVEQLDQEMAQRLHMIANQAPTRWQGLVDEWTSYIEMALEPEIQRIIFRDGQAVLGDISQWDITHGCVMALKDTLDQLVSDEVVPEIDTEATARLINGAASHAATWIATSDDPAVTSQRVTSAFRHLLNGIKSDRRSGN